MNLAYNINKLIMDRMKNELVGPLKRKIDMYSPVKDIFRFLSESNLILSVNLVELMNGDKVSFSRKIEYYSNFAIHIAIMIKYMILVYHDDRHTLAMFGETLQVNLIY